MEKHCKKCGVVLEKRNWLVTYKALVSGKKVAYIGKSCSHCRYKSKTCLLLLSIVNSNKYTQKITYHKNSEKRCEYARVWRINNPDKAKQISDKSNTKIGERKKRERREKNPDRFLVWKEGKKRCTTCREYKDVSEYFPTKKKYVAGACKSCLRVKFRTFTERDRQNYIKWRLKQRKELPDSYIAEILSKQFEILVKDVPLDLIPLKRKHLLIKRKLKEHVKT